MASDFCKCAPFETCGDCCPQQPKITVMGGTELTLGEAKLALEEAMKVIECVGTTGIYRQYERAGLWMKKYFPNWV